MLWTAMKIGGKMQLSLIERRHYLELHKKFPFLYIAGSLSPRFITELFRR